MLQVATQIEQDTNAKEQTMSKLTKAEIRKEIRTLNEEQISYFCKNGKDLTAMDPLCAWSNIRWMKEHTQVIDAIMTIAPHLDRTKLYDIPGNSELWDIHHTLEKAAQFNTRFAR